MHGMSALRVAVAHTNRPLPALYIPQGIPSPKMLQRDWVRDVFLFLNLLLPFCREFNFFFFYFYTVPQSFAQAAQEYMHCLVILTSMKGVLPPLECSVFLSPSNISDLLL